MEDTTQFVSDFFSRYRLIITILSVVLVISVIVVIIIFAAQDSLRSQEAENLYNLEQEYEEWTENFDPEDFNAEDTEEIIASILAYNFRSRSYADIRRNFILGSLNEQIDELDTAIGYYEIVTNEGRGYLVPLAILKTALLFEQSEDSARAENLYLQYVNEFDAPEEPRALFALGRLSESREDFMQAEVYYNTIIDEFSSSDWRNFAYNRLIDLKSRGIIE